MSKLSSPSDFTNINANYSQGRGFYTTHTDVSQLLQIAAFSSSTTPSIAEVGNLIKRAEERVDDVVGHSYRPVIYHNEFHNFEFFREGAYPVQRYKDYVGFVQLERADVQKIVRLEVWNGRQYVDLASATAKVKVPSSPESGSWRIVLGVGAYTFHLDKGVDFFDNYGPKTTASQIADAINEVFPHKTAKFTGETAAKTVTAQGASSVNISDFFYATTDSEAGDTVVISSLLLSDDGSACTISSTVGTTTPFTDHQDQRRLGDYWAIGKDGKIFFRQEYPHLHSNSIRVVYVSGEARVPATIQDAATKLVAAEVIRHDDNSILIAETGSNIDLKTKHDILLEEANAILNGKKDVIHFIM